MVRIARVLYLAIIVALCAPALAGAATPAVDLRVDQTAQPLGVDDPHPVLSWLPSVDQTAYRVRVGTSPGAQDVWDSGKVASSDSVGVAYGGPRPPPSTRHPGVVQV